jgi:transposase
MLPVMADTSSSEARRQALERIGLLHPRAEAVTAPLFVGGQPFFAPFDKVQVKYEMLRATLVDGVSATEAARSHGYSRAAFYLCLASFNEQGLLGLLDERRGRRGPLKLTPEIASFLREGGARSGAELAEEIEQRFGVRLHRRTVERARR